MSNTEIMDMSRVEPVRRLEVFTGAGRRRSWITEQKAQIVAESCAEGATVSAVAQRHGLTAQQLFVWRRKAKSDNERSPSANGVCVGRRDSAITTGASCNISNRNCCRCTFRRAHDDKPPRYGMFDTEAWARRRAGRAARVKKQQDAAHARALARRALKV